MDRGTRWACKEPDMTAQLTLSHFVLTIYKYMYRGEGVDEWTYLSVGLRARTEPCRHKGPQTPKLGMCVEG